MTTETAPAETRTSANHPERTSAPSTAALAEPDRLPQYSRRRILGVWAAAAVPMAVLVWLVAPLLAAVFDGSSAWPRAIVLTLTAGLVWQFILVLLLVHREQGSLRWSVLKKALWLQAPVSPRSGRRGGRLWLLLIPLVMMVAAKEMLPKLPAPAHRDLALFLQSVGGSGVLLRQLAVVRADRDHDDLQHRAR